MDPTVLSSLMAIGGMILGFLIRHCLGSPAPAGAAAPSNPVAAPLPAAAASQPNAASGSPTAHPLIAALTAQFDAAIQQLAIHFANSTLTAPTPPPSAPNAPSK